MMKKIPKKLRQITQNVAGINRQHDDEGKYMRRPDWCGETIIIAASIGNQLPLPATVIDSGLRFKIHAEETRGYVCALSELCGLCENPA